MSSKEEPTTRSYHGSCHCGAIKYMVRLTFPPILDPTSTAPSIRIYKCNCSTCVKMGLFHLRVIDPATDFVLLSPSDPHTELGDYRTFAKKTSWYFCKLCGVRCFSLGGEWESVELDLEKWSGHENTNGKMTKVWKPKSGEWKPVVDGKEILKPGCYLSVNATSIEPGQEGFSLKEWSEKGWVAYLDSRTRTGNPRVTEPYEGGIY